MHSGWKKRLASERGLTLVEIAIAVLIIALMMGVAIPSVSNITRADLKASAGKLSGSIRYTYDLAARKSSVFRLVFDLDEQTWWVESAADNFLLKRERTEVVDGMLEEPDDEDEDRRFVSRSFIESGQMWQPKRKATFANFAGPLTKKIALPQSIQFQDVWVAHQTEAVTAGLAYLYCFPTGMSERAVIHLVDEDENIYTLWVYPLTGRVKIYPHYVEAPDE